MSDILHTQVRPFTVQKQATVAELVQGMAGTSFQARNLAIAARIWRRMIEDDVTIFLGLAGAMVPAGMRNIVRHVIENRMIDVLVSTGANVFHDPHEKTGKPQSESN